MDNFTKYFGNCKGVFQGGGCKAVAYIGAYKEAYERGINFSEVAGTSAGSIVAALIAAGASPDRLSAIIGDLDFNQFDKSPVSKGKYKGMGWLAKAASSLLLIIGEMGRMVRNFLLYLGYRDSGSIESFMEQHLSDLLGIKNRTITFSDMKMPVSVISSDLQSNSVKVWSKDRTPNDSVAYAVRCSCSIPLYFQPVDGRYVDGGMLSNLPTFVFSESFNYDKVLAFSLSTPKGKEEDEVSLAGYLTSLANTVVDGSQGIQEQLNRRCYTVDIEVSGLSATDFALLQGNRELLATVMEQGAEAMRRFLASENLFMDRYDADSADCFFDLSQMSTQIAFNSVGKNDRVVVADKNTRWSWDLFLTLIKWKRDGSGITIYTLKDIIPAYREEEEARRRMFAYLGVEVRLVDSLPVNGYFFMKNGFWRAVVFNRGSYGDKFLSKYYHNKIDHLLIDTIMTKLSSAPHTLHEQLSLGGISVKSESEELIIEKLKTVSFYRDAKICFKRVRVEELLFITQYILGHKYRQIDVLYELYSKYSLEPFAAASIPLANGKDSLISPLVAEVHNGQMYIVSGDTRCFYAYRHRIEELLVVVVECVGERLPSNRSYRIEELLLTDRDTVDSERYEGFEHHLYRNIEQALRPDKDYLKD